MSPKSPPPCTPLATRAPSGNPESGSRQWGLCALWLPAGGKTHNAVPDGVGHTLRAAASACGGHNRGFTAGSSEGRLRLRRPGDQDPGPSSASNSPNHLESVFPAPRGVPWVMMRLKAHLPGPLLPPNRAEPAASLGQGSRGLPSQGRSGEGSTPPPGLPQTAWRASRGGAAASLCPGAGCPGCPRSLCVRVTNKPCSSHLWPWVW